MLDPLKNLKVEFLHGKPNAGLTAIRVDHDGTDVPWTFCLQLNRKGGLCEFDLEDRNGEFPLDVIHAIGDNTKPLNDPLVLRWREQILDEVERIVDEHVIANGGKL